MVRLSALSLVTLCCGFSYTRPPPTHGGTPKNIIFSTMATTKRKIELEPLLATAQSNRVTSRRVCTVVPRTVAPADNVTLLPCPGLSKPPLQRQTGYYKLIDIEDLHLLPCLNLLPHTNGGQRFGEADHPGPVKTSSHRIKRRERQVTKKNKSLPSDCKYCLPYGTGVCKKHRRKHAAGLSQHRTRQQHTVKGERFGEADHPGPQTSQCNHQICHSDRCQMPGHVHIAQRSNAKRRLDEKNKRDKKKDAKKKRNRYQYCEAYLTAAECPRPGQHAHCQHHITSHLPHHHPLVVQLQMDLSDSASFEAPHGHHQHVHHDHIDTRHCDADNQFDPSDYADLMVEEKEEKKVDVTPSPTSNAPPKPPPIDGRTINRLKGIPNKHKKAPKRKRKKKKNKRAQKPSSIKQMPPPLPSSLPLSPEPEDTSDLPHEDRKISSEEFPATGLPALAEDVKSKVPLSSGVNLLSAQPPPLPSLSPPPIPAPPLLPPEPTLHTIPQPLLPPPRVLPVYVVKVRGQGTLNEATTSERQEERRKAVAQLEQEREAEKERSTRKRNKKLRKKRCKRQFQRGLTKEQINDIGADNHTECIRENDQHSGEERNLTVKRLIFFSDDLASTGTRTVGDFLHDTLISIASHLPLTRLDSDFQNNKDVDLYLREHFTVKQANKKKLRMFWQPKGKGVSTSSRRDQWKPLTKHYNSYTEQFIYPGLLTSILAHKQIRSVLAVTADHKLSRSIRQIVCGVNTQIMKQINTTEPPHLRYNNPTIRQCTLMAAINLLVLSGEMLNASGLSHQPRSSVLDFHLGASG